jgi:hypothetical protein
MFIREVVAVRVVFNINKTKKVFTKSSHRNTLLRIKVLGKIL